jgi:hypothetical protein
MACILIDVAVCGDRNVTAKGNRREAKIREFMCRDNTNVEHAISGLVSWIV